MMQCQCLFAILFFRQELHAVDQCADHTSSNRHSSKSHQGDCGRPAAGQASVHTSHCLMIGPGGPPASLTAFGVFQDRGRRRWSPGRSEHPGAAAAAQQPQVCTSVFNLFCALLFNSCVWVNCICIWWKPKSQAPVVLIIFPSHTESKVYSSSFWTNEPSLLGHMTSLSSSFTPSPRVHQLPALPYSTPTPAFSSYQSPPLSGSFYFGPNHVPGDDRNIVNALATYIEGACLSVRGEEPVWRPYWTMPLLLCFWVTSFLERDLVL